MLLNRVFDAHKDEMGVIQREKVFSYTGGSAPRKMSIDLASQCPAEFWLRALGYESTLPKDYFIEGTLAHGCVEAYHKAKFDGNSGFDDVKAYLWSACKEEGLRSRIWDYFQSYIKYPTKYPDALETENVTYSVTSSEQAFKIDAVNYFNKSVISDDTKLQGRIDIIEDLTVFPIRKLDGRTIYVSHSEVRNAVNKIKNGDDLLRHEGLNFIIKKILGQKPVSKTQQKTISGELARIDQDKNAINVAVKLLRKKPIVLKNVTSDLKTGRGRLDFEKHLGQLSYYSYLRAISEGKYPQFASIIHIAKLKKPERERSIFSLKKSDVIEVVNKIERAVEVVDKKITTMNCHRCTNSYFAGRRCEFFALCHAEKISNEGVDAMKEIRKTIKRKVYHG